MRFVAVSDVHLDTPFVWAPRAVARRLRQSLRDALLAALRLADEVGADAVLLGGDLYEHERVTPDTAAFLRAALGDTHRPVYVAPGNHDWYGPASIYARTDWPGNVHVFTDDRLAPVTLAEGLTLWGAAHRSPANTDGFLDHFSVDRTGVHLGLLHGSERSGLAVEREGKEPHAPFRAEQVPAAGLHHAVCGHYHRPCDGAHHTYPGNPAPLTFGEHGLRGAVVIDVADDGAVTRQRHDVAGITWHDVEVDVTGTASLEEVRARASAALVGLAGVARLRVCGELTPSVDLDPATDLALDALRPAGAELEALTVGQSQLRVGYDTAAIAEQATVRGQFVRDVLDADLNDAERRRVLTVGLRALDGRDDLDVA